MDGTMCKGTNCPVKEQCTRFTAKACEFMQSYFVEEPFKDGKCDMYWGINQEKIFNQLKEITNNNR